MDLRECAALVPEINARAERLRDGALALPASDVVADRFAVVVEAARRGGERLTDDRLAATVALHFGLLADGDVVLAALANAADGRGVHVVSSTDELARRDADRARAIGGLLGLDVGLVVSDLDIAERKAAYQADVTCGRAEEFGYDYLRDNLSWSVDDLVQGELDRAFVAGIENDLVTYVISAHVDETKETLARITAYGYFRRYREPAGVGEASGTSFEIEDVWDDQCRDFYERRRRVLTGDDSLDFAKIAGRRSYERRCKEIATRSGFGPDGVPVLARQVVLSCYDSLWRVRLAELSRLREWSFSQADPVAEFRRHAVAQYGVMWELITRQAVDRFFTVDVTAR